MRKTAWIVWLLLGAVLLSCCASSGTGTPGGEKQTETALSFGGDGTPAEENGEEDRAVAFTQEGEALTVRLALEEKEAEVSVLLLSDREAEKTWRDDASVVIDIDQVKTDENGKAEARLTLPEDRPSAILFVTVDEKVYEREVR